MTMSDFDLINADLAADQGPRNAFPRAAQMGDQLTGEIIGAERRHRRDGAGQLLFWVDKKPSPIEAGPAVMDSVLIFATDAADDEDDDGRRFLKLDRDVKVALNTALAKAGVKTVAPGGRLERFTFLGQAKTGREYDGGTYIPPTA